MSPTTRHDLDALAARLAYPYEGEPAIQEEYTAVFDMTPSCSLNVGWHLFGETPDRASFLIALREALERAGVPEGSELPDHLSCILALLGREEPVRAAALASLVAPAVTSVRGALEERRSVYADLLAAVEAVIADFKAAPASEVRS